MSSVVSSSNSAIRKDKLDWLASFILLVCCAFWGFQQVLVKATMPYLPPLLQTGVRFFGATLILMLWCRYKGIPLFGKDLRNARNAGLMAGALFAAEFLFMYLALARGSAARTTLFLYTSPFWVALILPWLVQSETLRKWQWAGLVIAFLGVLIALRDSFGASPAQGFSLLTDLMGLAAGICWGLTTVVMRATAMRHWSPEKVLFYQIAVSAVVLSALSFARGESWNMSQLNGFTWLSLFLQTVIGAFASFLTWMWLMSRYPATLLSSFTFLTPVFALIFSAWWLAEPVTGSLVLALGLVALGIVLVNRS